MMANSSTTENLHKHVAVRSLCKLAMWTKVSFINKNKCAKLQSKSDAACEEHIAANE